MRNKPHTYAYGLIFGAALFSAGVLFQWIFGRIEWACLHSPINCSAALLFLFFIVFIHLLRRKIRFFAWLASIQCAVTSIVWASALTVIMGLVRQIPSEAGSSPFPGFAQMTSNWSFVLIWFWMLLALGLTILRVCIPLKKEKVPFLLNHLGLLVALLCGTLGSADFQRMRMSVERDITSNSAIDNRGKVHELPFSVELNSFRIEEYPPRLLMVDDISGKALPYDAPDYIILDESSPSADLNGWSVSILRVMDFCTPAKDSGNVNYLESLSSGACTAALIRLTKPGGTSVTDWVSCGSYAFPEKTIALGGKVSVVMPEREPQRYISEVTVRSRSGKTVSAAIEVNKPLNFDGWKLYQLDFDHSMGRWSDVSVLEIIKDPWMTPVYVGIYLMIAGAVCMFVKFGRKKEVKR